MPLQVNLAVHLCVFVGSYTLQLGEFQLSVYRQQYPEKVRWQLFLAEEDFENEVKGGNSLVILGLVKENFNILFHTSKIFHFKMIIIIIIIIIVIIILIIVNRKQITIQADGMEAHNHNCCYFQFLNILSGYLKLSTFFLTSINLTCLVLGLSALLDFISLKSMSPYGW